jgi:hypothetical protein
MFLNSLEFYLNQGESDITLSPCRSGLVLSSPPATEETVAIGRDIQSRRFLLKKSDISLLVGILAKKQQVNFGN